MHASFKHLIAAGLLVVGVGACDLEPEIDAPFTPTGRGTLAGQVFFDSNDNKQYDPVAGDSLITSARIEVSERGDSTKVIATGAAGAEGRFSIENVPVGSYEVRAIVTGNQTITCAPVTASVYIGESAFAPTPTRVSCRIDMVVAETRPLGTLVTVAGVVTAEPGIYRPVNMYLQDSTGGMQAFNVPGGTASGIARGDSIEITGPLGQFGQELQVSPVNSVRIVRPDARIVAPRERTFQQLLDEFGAEGTGGNKARVIGTLIEVKGVTVEALPANNSPATGTGHGTDFRLRQGTRTLNIRLDVGANIAIPVSRFAGANRCFDITGILGYFSPNLQLKPRDLNDIKDATCPAT